LEPQEGADEQAASQEPIGPNSEIAEPPKKTDERVGNREAQEEADEQTKIQDPIVSDKKSDEGNIEVMELQDAAHEQTESQGLTGPDSEAAEPQEKADECTRSQGVQKEVEERIERQDLNCHRE